MPSNQELEPSDRVSPVGCGLLPASDPSCTVATRIPSPVTGVPMTDSVGPFQAGLVERELLVWIADARRAVLDGGGPNSL